MYSEAFMRYLMNYQAEENEPKQKEGVQEIDFKNCSAGRLARVYVTIKK